MCVAYKKSVIHTGWAKKLSPKMFNHSTLAFTQLGTVLQIVSSGMILSTLLCSSRSMPSRRRRAKKVSLARPVDIS